MLEGKCPKCGFHSLGWALSDSRHQTCPKCGTLFEITEPSHINPSTEAGPPDKRGKDGHVERR
jgi:phage FluMu protein Com